MPKPRKPLRITYTPPESTGWYGYKHACSEPEAIYLDEIGLKNAQDRFQLAIGFDILPADIWSIRKLKKRERGERERGTWYGPGNYVVL